MAVAFSRLLRRCIWLAPRRLDHTTAFSSSAAILHEPPADPPPRRILRHLGKQSAVPHHFQRDAIALRRIIEERRWDSTLERSLSTASVSLSDGLVVEVIKVLSEARLALRFFIWAMERLKLSTNTNAVLARRWCHEKEFGIFLNILQNRHQVMSPESYLILITGYGWAGMVDKALETLETMKRQGVDTFSAHFMSIIDTLLREKQLDVVPTVYEQMVQAGHFPDVHTYNKLISEFCVAGLKEEALKLLHEMKGRNLRPKPDTYKIAISAFNKANRFDEVIWLASEIEDRVELDVKSCNALVKCLCLADKTMEALEVLESMIRKDLSPNLVSVAMVANGLLDSGNTDKVFGLWKQLNKDLTKTLAFQERLVKELCDADKRAEAEEVFEFLRSNDSMPSKAMYGILIREACKLKNVRRGCEIFLEMPEKLGAHDKETCNTLISSLCEAGNMVEGGRILHHMVQQGADADYSAYHTLLIGFCKAGSNEKVQQCLSSIQKKCKCNSLETETYYSVVSDLCKTEDLMEASTFLQEMVDISLVPPLPPCNELIKIFETCLGGKEDKAATKVEDAATNLSMKEIRGN